MFICPKGQKTRRLFRGSSASNGDGTEGGDEGAASETNGQKEEEDEEETVIIAEGVIVAFLAASDEDAPLWKNYHFQDGEVEDLEYHEVKQAKMNHRIKLKKPRGGIFAGDNEADVSISLLIKLILMLLFLSTLRKKELFKLVCLFTLSVCVC